MSRRQKVSGTVRTSSSPVLCGAPLGVGIDWSWIQRIKLFVVVLRTLPGRRPDVRAVRINEEDLRGIATGVFPTRDTWQACVPTDPLLIYGYVGSGSGASIARYTVGLDDRMVVGEDARRFVSIESTSAWMDFIRGHPDGVKKALQTILRGLPGIDGTAIQWQSLEVTLLPHRSEESSKKRKALADGSSPVPSTSAKSPPSSVPKASGSLSNAETAPGRLVPSNEQPMPSWDASLQNQGALVAGSHSMSLEVMSPIGPWILTPGTAPPTRMPSATTQVSAGGELAQSGMRLPTAQVGLGSLSELPTAYTGAAAAHTAAQSSQFGHPLSMSSQNEPHNTQTYPQDARLSNSQHPTSGTEMTQAGVPTSAADSGLIMPDQTQATAEEIAQLAQSLNEVPYDLP